MMTDALLAAGDFLFAALALAGLAGLGWWLLPKHYQARGRDRWKHNRW